MSSKKYDANIGTTRQARAAQQAAFVTLRDVFSITDNLFYVGLFETVSFLLVLRLQKKTEEECKHTEA